LAATDFGAKAKLAYSEGVLPEAGNWRGIVYPWRKLLAEDHPVRFALAVTKIVGQAPRHIRYNQWSAASGWRFRPAQAKQRCGLIADNHNSAADN